jgi:mediator of RNA polymerase II transcription subunit 11
MAKTTEQITRLNQLENVEIQIAKALDFSGQALNELAKDKANNKTTESHTSQFIKALETIETDLAAQINYLTTVSTGQPHEGSSYAAQKDLQMAQHRMEHVKSRLGELDQMRLDHRTHEPRGGNPTNTAVQRSLTFSDVTQN